jgi:hypothetical protein
MPFKDLEKRRAAARQGQSRLRAKRKAAGTLSQHDRAEKLRQRFNKSAEWYAAQLAKQDNACAVCKRPKEENAGFELSVDHDHKCCPDRTSCGECVRGLLCNRCNRALGLLGDSIEVLKEMIAYLQAFKEKAYAAGQS